MKKYELGIYTQGINSAECVKVLHQGTFDECLDRIKDFDIEENQFFDISELDKNGLFTGNSWQYYR